MHIGILFSEVVKAAHLSFFTSSFPIRISQVPAVTPPPAAAARLDSIPMPMPEKKQQARRAPARVDHPFKGIALVLLSTIFLGCSDVTAKYLSTSLPSIEITWIRFVTFALMFTPVMLPGSPLHAMRTERLGLQLMRGVALLGSSLFFITGLSFLPDRGSFRHRLRFAAVRHRAVDRLPQREGRHAPLDRDRDRPDRRA